MSTIKISKSVKNDLYNSSRDGESMDSFINRLLDCVEDDLMNRVVVDGGCNVNLYPDTLERLQGLKKSSKDSYTKILRDALELYNQRR